MNIVGVILGAGLSNRMGKNKMILPINGLPMIGYVIKATDNSSLQDIICVYSPKLKDNSVFHKLKKHKWKKSIKWLNNEAPSKGQSSSIKIALKNCLQSDAIMILLGDQPCLHHDILDNMIILSKNHPSAIIRTIGGGHKGPPIIIPRFYYEELLSIDGDIGARDLLKKHKDKVIDLIVDSPGFNIDVDTPDEYRDIIELMKDGEIYEGFFTRGV